MFVIIAEAAVCMLTECLLPFPASSPRRPPTAQPLLPVLHLKEGSHSKWLPSDRFPVGIGTLSRSVVTDKVAQAGRVALGTAVSQAGCL